MAQLIQNNYDPGVFLNHFGDLEHICGQMHLDRDTAGVNHGISKYRG
jgi:hypothetical protein